MKPPEGGTGGRAVCKEEKEMARKPRTPKWDEQNRIRAAGFVNPNDWRVLKSNQEIMIIWNKRTGTVREIEMGGKLKPRYDRIDVSENLARELARKGNVI